MTKLTWRAPERRDSRAHHCARLHQPTGGTDHTGPIQIPKLVGFLLWDVHDNYFSQKRTIQINIPSLSYLVYGLEKQIDALNCV